MTKIHTALCATSALSLVVLAHPSAAFAQAAPAATKSSYDLSEVVVVAQRRSERLQDVPLSVTAITAAALTAAGVSKSTDLALVTPGLQMSGTVVYNQPVIRGVGSTVTSPSYEANVATYVDGAYQQSLVGGIYDLPDVEAIEVLKGPQGTLFGRNATGGAILINTKAPNLTRMEGSAYASYGNFNSFQTKAFVTAPIIQDKLAFSLTGFYDWTDGWKKNIVTGASDESSITSFLVRAKLRYIPWDGADFTLTGLFSKRKDYSVSKGSMYMGNNSARLVPGTIIASQPYTYSHNVLPYLRRQQVAFTLHGDIEMGPGKLSTTTYTDLNPAKNPIDLDNTNAALSSGAVFSHTQNIEQEVVYTTNQLGRFRAVGGVFYYNLRSRSGLGVNNFTSSVYTRDKDNAFAGFGEATYNLTDQLSLVGGMRYSHEHRQSWAVAGSHTPIRPPYSFIGEHTWHAFTPRVSALYKLTPRTNVYATFSKGFTAGIFNASSFQTTPINPEHVKSYEVGIKSNEIARLSWSGAAFYYDYSDLQTFSLSQRSDGLTIQTLGNAAKAKIRGAELNAAWRATDNFDITAGGTYVHARYSSYPNAPILTPILTPTGFAGNTNTIASASGNAMVRQPTWSGNVTAHYHQDFEAGAFDGSATLYHASRIYFDIGNIVSQSAYTVVNGNLSWTPAGGKLRLSVWGKNLTNKAYLLYCSCSTQSDNVDYGEPRSYGVSAQYNF